MREDLTQIDSGRCSASFYNCFQKIIFSSKGILDEFEGSPFLLQSVVPEQDLINIVHELVERSGIHALHSFISLGLKRPEKLLAQELFASILASSLLAQPAVQAIILAIIRRYRLRRYFTEVLRLGYRNDEYKSEAIAQYLQSLAGSELTCATLLKKLQSRNVRFRVFLLFLLASFQDQPIFTKIRPQLYRLYVKEPEEFVRSIYEQLFSF